MANPIVTTVLGNPDPTTTVQNLTQLCAVLNTLLQSSIQGSYQPYVVSSGTPAVNDQDKIWFRLDNGGRPIGTFYFYNGNWRRTYTAQAGDVKFYSGNPSNDFDSTGLGIIGGNQDGWALMNGQNGTADLSNTFIATANMNSSGGGTQYGTAWQSFVDGLTVKQSGGAASQILQSNELPTIRVTVSGNRYTGGSDQSPNRSIIIDNLYNTGAGSPSTQTVGVFGSNPTPSPNDPNQTPIPQVPVPTTPTFYSLAICTWLGYA